MHFRHLLAGLGALVLLAVGPVAHAQQTQSVGQHVAVCNPSWPAQCIQAGPFTPDALSTVSLAVTSASGRVALTGTGGTVLVTNNDTTDFYVKLGGSTVTAATTSFYVKAGSQVPLARGTNTYIAAITASGTSTMIASTGNGTPSGGSGGGGSSSGGGVAGFTAAAAPYSVGAGTNKPAGIDTANSAQFFVPVVPGSTTTIDLSGPSGVKGVDGSAIASSTNLFPVRTYASAAGGGSMSHAIVAANTTSVAIDASPGTLYSVQVFNNSATIAYLKLYDAAQGSTTCGSGTPKKVILIPASTSGAGAVIPLGGGAGVAFATAITRCVTTGIADNDTGAPGATTYLVEADYK